MKWPKQFVYLQGGLGNQMFQYAFYLALKHFNPNTIYDCSLTVKDHSHNGYELERVFNLEYKTHSLLKILARFFSYLSFKKQRKTLNILSNFKIVLVEDTIPSTYTPSILSLHQRALIFYLGYWQTEKYFKGIEDIIKKNFTFSLAQLSNRTKKCAIDIKKSNSVSIHIRRGDYLEPQFNHLYGNICTTEYYETAISIIKEKYNNENIHFYIFSDDIDWVKSNLHIDFPSTFIDWNTQKDSWQDMFLMSQCKHNIIANSSFSWWGAWLNNNPQKIVICPSRFMNIGNHPDIIPENWIKI